MNQGAEPATNLLSLWHIVNPSSLISRSPYSSLAFRYRKQRTGAGNLLPTFKACPTVSFRRAYVVLRIHHSSLITHHSSPLTKKPAHCCTGPITKNNLLTYLPIYLHPPPKSRYTFTMALTWRCLVSTSSSLVSRASRCVINTSK